MPKTATAKDKHVREYRAFSNPNINTSVALEDDGFNPEKHMEKTWKMVEKRAALIQKFKMIEPHLPKEEVLEYKKQLGLIKDDESGNMSDSMDSDMPLMIELLKSEKDPKVRQQLTMAMLSKRGGVDSNMMMLASMMGNVNQPQGDSFEKEMFRELVKDKLSGGSKNDPVEQMKNTMELIQLAKSLNGDQGNPIEEMKDNIKAYREIGIIGDKGSSLDEKKLEFEREKFTYEKDMELEKEKTEAEKQKNLINLASKSLVKIIPALIKNKGVQYDDDEEDEPVHQREQVTRDIPPEPEIREPIQSEEPTDIINHTCSNPECKRTFQITHITEPRMLACPNIPLRKCSYVYELLGDGRMKVYELSGKDLEDAVIKYGGEPKPSDDENGKEE